MIPETPEDVYMRYECINFECQINPTGYYLEIPLHDDIADRPVCRYCGVPMIREDEMAKNILLWELGFDVEES